MLSSYHVLLYVCYYYLTLYRFQSLYAVVRPLYTHIFIHRKITVECKINI